MKKRHYDNWLHAFMQYASINEAPEHIYFWVGVSTIAGALRRKCYFDMGTFKWYPNFYIVLLAPSGIIAKSTTADLGMNLLRKIPGVKFGPDVVTWQSLITSLSKAAESFIEPKSGKATTMSCLTFASSEFGNLLNPKDREMVDMYVNLYDSRDNPFRKETKTQGDDVVTNAWVNLIACTTPSWLAQEFPEYTIGGGFMSRCIFVFGDNKAKLVSYPKRANGGKNLEDTKRKLVEDLAIISELRGEFDMTEEAYHYGEVLYRVMWEGNKFGGMDPEKFGGYWSRRQSHIHKLAMIISAATSDDMLITREQLATAHMMIEGIEPDMQKVFSMIGRSEEAKAYDYVYRLIVSLGEASNNDIFLAAAGKMPKSVDFDACIDALIRQKRIVPVVGKDGVPRVKAL
ncbi:MAG: hypothetical protein E6Q97_04515 [Desulfurellales bacterium]|nr:MAG: hypothetical protein E6Q97_04515 [Desulfurellales bacterium]